MIIVAAPFEDRRERAEAEVEEDVGKGKKSVRHRKLDHCVTLAFTSLLGLGRLEDVNIGTEASFNEPGHHVRKVRGKGGRVGTGVVYAIFMYCKVQSHNSALRRCTLRETL